MESETPKISYKKKERHKTPKMNRHDAKRLAETSSNLIKVLAKDDK
jgi:hypothetical protein